MEDRRRIEERLHKKEQEIQTLEERLRAARVYVQALQDVLKLLDSDDASPTRDTALRPGSAVAQARQVILDRGEPVHILALLKALGKDANRDTRASLTSSLAAYVRRGEIFTRPAPNTFGLIELGHNTTPEQEEPDGPPTGFGAVRRIESAPPVPPSHTEGDEEIPF